ncbi:hypothetical protein NL676_031535 [Syzygium grande]|nr:hypothetical protein NL676_031535 [Syzygium grande]
MLMSFFNPEALMRSVGVIDEVTMGHLRTHWEGKYYLEAYSTLKQHTFDLSCWLFMSITDPQLVSRLADHFHVFLKGVVDLPLKVPGTNFYQSKKAADSIRKELQMLVKRRQTELEKKTASSARHHVAPDLLIIKYLSELPHVLEKVIAEQREIAASKGRGELLHWGFMEDEILLECHLGSHEDDCASIWFFLRGPDRDPNYYPRTLTFDESRFEGSGPAPNMYIPFGGGLRMCLGLEFTRAELLVFLHNLVNQFHWSLVNPDEKIIYEPMPKPVEGLPIRL